MVRRFGVGRKAVLNTMNVCVLLVIRQAKRMSSNFIIISGLFDCTVVFALCHKRHDFRKHNI
jgi:hypothetical protein